MEEQSELTGLTEAIGLDHFYPTAHAAVQAFGQSRESSA
jgi:hypothetical protein